jgi:hypothetical protein
MATKRTEITEDFALNAAQMEYMLRIHNAAEKADAEGNDRFFHELVETEEWKSLFQFGWDQAWDRYEIMIGQCEDC